ncbi:UDP-4-amino-4,6-dideoxy-N-acetyl-beta-L-altrosamine transaminase [Paenibacillus validus]|uniref:UDP-4-amino-4, 6-dideoxy-N-acetyl-beta-L-altrosamine transaminase n=1 Tax=Paenibacillus TaxID=44249 RepID=UPI0019153BC4|nr:MULTISPECIES: UDP-4-amino-4,6-dideoxy-N-acetyl-beta-L-altrosamine transaminase [Paenibacillus]MED4601259.1 UDP-4-amino-4,6-dideoxy-N-acetyl-beta-L-altrosamine transaminase [Paenibacillus validus]MED4605464.1 UDP-4-amino-4,6-dideoxy-N-acetyl-beta-L-altrosamine transaminase [Paenibacillus validus]
MEKLAIQGGVPVRSTMLAYGQQWIDERDIDAVVSVLRGPFITQGPYITEFEKEVASYAGARYAVAFSSGTAALHGACFAAGIGTGDEVITTPITFVASSNCVLYCGGTPVFADIDPATYNIDPEDIKRKITPRTKAIIPVDFTGQPVEIEAIMNIAREHGLLVIQDAAHSLGAEYQNRKIGSFADMTMFSFHPVKHVTTGEGGVIVTDREDLYRKLQLFRSHGITKDPSLLTQDEGPWYYEMHELGYHYRLTDLQAALGSSQMKKLDEFVRKRREIAAYYHEAFANLPGIRIPYQAAFANSSWHLYMLRFEREAFKVDRQELFLALRAENIGVHVHYIPVYKQPYYQRMGYSSTHCPEAEAFYQEAITLPLFPKMTRQDVEDVVRAVKKIYQQYVQI